MRVVVYDRGSVATYDCESIINLAGDPRVRTSVAREDRGTWACQIRSEGERWSFELGAVFWLAR